MASTNSGLSISLRPESQGDEPFLFTLFVSTRDEFLFLDEAQRDAILRMQFEAQKRHYTANLPGARKDIVLLDEKPIGKLTTVWTEQEIRLADIALLPEYRDMGIGSKLIMAVLAEADKDVLSVRLHVRRQSRAMRLYRRFGFSEKETNEIFCMMERPPGTFREIKDYR